MNNFLTRFIPQSASRKSLATALIAAFLTTACTASAQKTSEPEASVSKETPSFLTTIDFKNPEWNRDTYARLDGDLDPTKEKVGWLKGKVFGVRPNEAVRELFIMEGFSFTRTKKLPDGSIRRMLREVVFYKDPKTGEILETWDNPYTGETVRVVPIANDPYNFTISAYKQQANAYAGTNLGKPEKEPFLLNWEEGPNDTLILNTGINLFYPNRLQPSTWVRESAGTFNRVSEQFIYVLKKADVENPAMTHVPAIGTWSRITPWLPWMLMGQAEGHISYFSTFTTLPGGLDELPADIREAARAIDPKFLAAPTEDYGPNESSLEAYATEQTPAPVPEGWEPPKAPAAPVWPPKQ